MTRPLLFLLAGFVLLLLQASLRRLLPTVVLMPEAALVLVVYLGVTPRGGAPAVGALTLVLGYLADLLSGSPKGFHALAFVIIFFLSRGAQLRLLTRGRFFEIWFSLAAALVSGLVATTVSTLAAPRVGFRGLGVEVLHAVATGLLAPVVFSLGRLIDRRTSRVPHREKLGAPKVLMK